jgi:hypothetical protein
VGRVGYYMHRTGALVCSGCWRKAGDSTPESLKGQGYAIPVWGESGLQLVEGACVLCAVNVKGEIMEKAREYCESTRVDSGPQA